MKQKKVFASLFIIVVLAGLLVLTAYQPAGKVVAASHEDVEHVDFNYEQAAAHATVRWTAMGQAYEKSSLFSHNAGPDDTATARWNAMGQAYEKSGLFSYNAGLDDTVSARWNAMGQAYEKSGLFSHNAGLDDTASARWNAMAMAYEKSGLLQ